MYFLLLLLPLLKQLFFLHFNDMFNIIGLQNYRYVHVHDDFPFHFYIMYNETFINFFVKMLF